jgi:hypothetical protein
MPGKCVNDFLRRRVRVNFRQTRTVSSEYRRRHQDHDGILPLPQATNVGGLCNGATGWPRWAQGVAPGPSRSMLPWSSRNGGYRSVPSTA